MGGSAQRGSGMTNCVRNLHKTGAKAVSVIHMVNNLPPPGLFHLAVH